MKRRELIGGLAGSIASIIAGCASQGSSPATESDITTTRGPTTTSSDLPYQGESPSNNLDNPADVTIQNEDTKEHTISITITVNGETILSRTRKLKSDTTVEIPDVAAAKTTYSVSAQTESGATLSDSWKVTDTKKGIKVRVTPTGELEVSQLMSAGGQRTATGTRPHLPYRADNPSKNVETARSLTFENHDNDLHLLEVQITTNQTVVMNREYKLAAGSSETTDPLIAKKGTYTITVSEIQGMDSTTFEWSIDNTQQAVTIQITDNGEMEVHRSGNL